MTAWLSDLWFYLPPIVGSVLLLTLYVRARREPEGAAMALWRHISSTARATGLAFIVCILISAIFVPTAVRVILSPAFLLTLFGTMWVAEPYIRRWLAGERREP
jgi:hypothetical protein